MPLPLRSRRRVPSPLIPLTVRVYVSPLPVTEAMVALAFPVVAKVKSEASTPVTDWLNFTV